MQPIRILHVVGTMNRGGAETFLMNVLRNIDRNKFKFIFLCYGNEKFDYEDEIIALGAEIIRTPDVKNVGVFEHIRNIEKIIKEGNINVVHAHTCFNSMFSLVAAKRVGISRRISHAHTSRSEYRPSFVKRLYFAISKFIVNKYSTDYIACGQEAGKALYYRSNAFTIVDNGIILKDYYFNVADRRKIRKELDIPEDSAVVGHVGRIDIQKNQRFIIDIFKEFLKLSPNSKLMLVGDGVLREEIENKIQASGLQDDVYMLGKRSDVKNLYNAMDTMLFPSLREGVPLTIIEAQANGLPCLISDTIDRTTKVTDNVFFYSLSKNAELWARELHKIDKKRTDNKKTLEAGPFNIIESVKRIEHLYEVIQ